MIADEIEAARTSLALGDAEFRRVSEAEAERIYEEAEGRRLLAELTREVQELDLASLKIYGAGGLILYATDAHRIGHLSNLHYGVAVARRGWATKADVVNTRPLDAFLASLKKV